MFKKTEPSSINEDILSQGFGQSNGSPEDAVVIDASEMEAAPTPSKKRKLQRVATVAGAGFVLLGIAAAIVTLQNKPVAVDPAVDAVLNKQPAPVPKPADVAVTTPAPTQPAASSEPAATLAATPAPEPAAAAQLSGPAVIAPAASPASLEKQPAQPAAAKAAQTPTTIPVDIDKRLGEMDKSYLNMVGVLAKLAMRLDDVTAAQKELKRDLERLTKQQATAAQAEKKASAPVAAKPVAQEQPKAKSSAQASERVEKAISMKEFNILAMTTESIIFGPQGKEQEVFVGAAMPGLNGKLETVDPQNRTIVTSTRIYKVTH